MRVPEPVRVVLELEHGLDTITGHVAIAGDPAARFYGWLELIDRLDRGTAPSRGREPEAESSGKG
jgi:hypothetical protein